MAQQDFTVADVLAWARTKPADQSYSYGDIFNCALCQFLKETGRAVAPIAGGITWEDRADGKRANGAIPAALQHPLTAGTFGGLVARLEKLCPEIPITQSNWAAIDAYLSEIETVSA